MRPITCALLLLVSACSSPRGNQPPAAPPADEGTPPDEAPPFASPPPPPAAADAAPPPPPPPATTTGSTSGGAQHYISDCSLTHPIGRDPCSGRPPETRGLASCASLGVTRGQACGQGAPGCYVDRACKDGHTAVSDYLICAAEAPSRCFTRSSRRYKADIAYLSVDERRSLARQVQSLPLARFRYLDTAAGNRRLGLLTEDALTTEFVSDDGRTVDLYALLTGALAAIQTQDERIRALEAQLEQCRP